MQRKETIPLLHDHHAHFSGRAAYLDCVDLSSIQDKDEAILTIMGHCSREEMNVVQGWNDSFYSFSDSELKKMPPVFIWNVSGHGLVFNEKAERKAIAKFNDPNMFKKMKDPNWVERNLLKVSKLMMKIEGITEDKILRTNDLLLGKGIYSTDDMLLPSEETLEKFKKLKLADKTTFWADLDTFHKLNKSAKKEIEGIKLFVDGALGPRTAALNEDYLDGGNGVMVYGKEEFEDTLLSLEKDKIAVHAIGDRAIEMIIDTLSKIERNDSKIPKTRIEHAQFIDKETAMEANSLGITLSMQPNFSLDSKHYSDRLSEKYLKKNNPFRMLIDEVGFVPGKDLLFGSDGLPYGVKEALETSLFPEYESQELTLDEFIDGYCLDRNENGSINFVIDEDKREVSVEEIKI